MPRSDPQLNFRIPAELRERLDAAAVTSGRSLTAELVKRLNNSFALGPAEGDGALVDVPTADLLAELGRRCER